MAEPGPHFHASVSSVFKAPEQHRPQSVSQTMSSRERNGQHSYASHDSARTECAHLVPAHGAHVHIA